MINKVILVGRITSDPALRKTSTGISTVGFTLACNRKYSNSQGGQDADFINCVAWRQSADFIANYVKKGALLGIEGKIQTRNYKNQNDRIVYVTEVVCESVRILAQKQAQAHEHVQTHEQTNDYLASEENPYGFDIESDDLPF